MIRVTRPPPPQHLTKHAAKWKNKLFAALMAEAANKTEETVHAVKLARNKYVHPEIRKTLGLMFHGKCAYCESKVTHVAYAPIEHYCPKSRFPDLTFQWDNLLLACGICNGPEYKGDHFPEAAEDGPLLNPCEEDPGLHLRFHFDEATGIASVIGVTPRGITTVHLLGLNRHDLRETRSKEIKKLAVLARMAAANPQAAQLLVAAKQDDAQYAAFARVLP